MPDARRTDPPRPAWSGAIAAARFRAGMPRGRSLPGKAVGAFIPGLTRKAFEKFGFSTASLIMDWPRIAGADLAQWTTPERVKWPPGVAAPLAQDDGGGRPGATLVLRVDPARALDVEYRSRQIIERINAYFGYRAIAELRILQAPLPERGSATSARSQPAAATAPGAADSGDPLARALARMQAAVNAANLRG